MNPTSVCTVFLEPNKGNVPLGLIALKKNESYHHLKVTCSYCCEDRKLVLKADDQVFIPEISGFGFKLAKCPSASCRNQKKKNVQYISIKGQKCCVGYAPMIYEGFESLRLAFFGLEIKKYCGGDPWEISPGNVVVFLGDEVRLNGLDGNVVRAVFTAKAIAC